MPSNAAGGSRNPGTPPSKTDACRRLRPFSIATAALLAGPWKGGLWQSGLQKTIARGVEFAAGVGGVVRTGWRLSRRQDHDHLPPFKTGVLFDLSEFGRIVAHAIQQFGPQLLVSHFAASEA